MKAKKLAALTYLEATLGPIGESVPVFVCNNSIYLNNNDALNMRNESGTI